MKKLFYVTLSLLLMCVSCANEKRNRVEKAGQFYDSQESETGFVYICTGKTAHAYHSNEDCYGLSSCKGDVISVSLDEAEDMGRTPCHYCHK